MSKARGLADLGNAYNDGALSNRNLIINGNLAVNQRGLSIASVATGAYGEDRWKKTAGGMTQIIEEANYLPNTVYTLSGTNVTTQQITSPASGNWTLPDIPVTARLIQLEVGDTATPFEHRSYGDELARCQRYYQTIGYQRSYYYSPIASGGAINVVRLPVTMRAVPTITTSQFASVNVLSVSMLEATSQGFSYYHRNNAIGHTDYQWSNTLDAEL
jgi:hypothetical protein